MNHTESSIKIYFSKDYSLFNMINGNRQLNQAKIKKIKKDIVSGLDVLRFCPILVIERNGRLDIIDGQHRYWVSKELKSKVWYIIVEEFTLMDIAKINSNTEKWKTDDFINCFVQQGNDNYVKLRDFMEETNFPLSVSTRLLSRGHISADSGMDKNDSEKFKRGQFSVLHETAAQKFVAAAKLFNVSPVWNARHFLLAIEIVLKNGKCDFIELVDKFKANPGELKKKDSVKEYLNNLEEIYNYRMRQRRVIY